MRISLLSLLCAAGSLMLPACGGDDDAPAPAPAPVALTCNDSLKTAFKPDANTTVTLVKQFRKGESLMLTASAAPTALVASNDVCVVKLNVGPGNPGPADAPSTSPGISIEVWLPTLANWNGRTHASGDGAFAGNAVVGSQTGVRTDIASWAMDRGYVSSISDSGHQVQAGVNIGAFGMKPDGTINQALWVDLATRSIHELAVKTKALSTAYYAKSPNYNYYGGCSGAGRTGYASAQYFPNDFDGIFAPAPSINQTQFKPDQMWSTFVTQRDLGGVALTVEQSALITNAVVNACDTQLNGTHDGHISDPATCRYDPTKDTAVLCTSAGGTNTTAACVTRLQANAVNKMWYGPTIDGSVPDPAVDNGFNVVRAPNQLWWGLPRGGDVSVLTRTTAGLVADGLAQVTLSLQNGAIGGGPSSGFFFKNAASPGADGWKNMSYGDFANAMIQGRLLNKPWFGDIDTNNEDLSAFQRTGHKMITLYGLADAIVPLLSAVDYYNRSAAIAGGYQQAQSFHRLYLEPGRGHCDNVAGAGVLPGAPAPKLNQGNANDTTKSALFDALVDWVEKGTAPGPFVATTTDGTKSRPICLYPAKLTYVSGNPNAAASYVCK